MNSKATTADVIIVGGSYAGLAAAMSLGRARRTVILIDSGKPCNRTAPQAHNFLGFDGQPPATIASRGREQVFNYPTLSFVQALAEKITPLENGFRIEAEGKSYEASKVLFAAGIKDQMPDLKGFAECWGISVLHCPYCHGYEVADQPLGILAKGATAYALASLVFDWSNDLTVFSNGPSMLDREHWLKLEAHKIRVVETPIRELEHQQGQLQAIVLEDGSRHLLQAAFARPAFEQHCALPASLGCELSQEGYLLINEWQMTNIPGIYVAGDAASGMRSIANAVAAGSRTGAFIHKKLIEERF